MFTANNFFLTPTECNVVVGFFYFAFVKLVHELTTEVSKYDFKFFRIQ